MKKKIIHENEIGFAIAGCHQFFIVSLFVSQNYLQFPVIYLSMHIK